MVRACFAASEAGEFANINGAMKSLCQDLCLQTKFHQKVGRLCWKTNPKNTICSAKAQPKKESRC